MIICTSAVVVQAINPLQNMSTPKLTFLCINIG